MAAETIAPLRLETLHGPLNVTLWAGPKEPRAITYARDGEYPQRAVILGRALPDPYCGATVTTPEDAPLIVNGIRYTLNGARFAPGPLGWTYDPAGWGYDLKREGSFSADSVTTAARAAFREAIIPAVAAFLATLTAEIAELSAIAAGECQTATRALAAELDAEADRLRGLVA